MRWAMTESGRGCNDESLLPSTTIHVLSVFGNYRLYSKKYHEGNCLENLGGGYLIYQITGCVRVRCPLIIYSHFCRGGICGRDIR